MTEFSTPTNELLEKLRKLKQIKADIKEHEDFIKKNKDDAATLEQECVIMMDNASVQQIKVDGALLYRRTDKYARIDPELKVSAYGWLKDHGLGYLIQDTVNARSLTSALAELPDVDMKDLPASIKVSPVERIGIRTR